MNKRIILAKGFVDPALYTTDTLSRDHLALLKCIKDTPVAWSASCEIRPVTGKYYLAFSSMNNNWYGEKEKDSYSAMLMDERGRGADPLPMEDFEVIDDPCGVMQKKRNYYWYLWNYMKWLHAKMEQRDKSCDLYSEDYLREHRLALVKYAGPGVSKNRRAYLKTGKQYLSITHVPDLSEAVYIKIIVENPDGMQETMIDWFSDFDHLSDPLGLIDPWKTKWEDNEQEQKKLRPDLYPQKDMEKHSNKARTA